MQTYFNPLENSKNGVLALIKEPSPHIEMEVSRVKKLGVKIDENIFYNDRCHRILLKSEYDYYQKKLSKLVRTEIGKKVLLSSLSPNHGPLIHKNIDDWLNGIDDEDYIKAANEYEQDYGYPQNCSDLESRLGFISYFTSSYGEENNLIVRFLRDYEEMPLIVAENNIKSYMQETHSLKLFVQDTTEDPIAKAIVEGFKILAETIKNKK